MSTVSDSTHSAFSKENENSLIKLVSDTHLGFWRQSQLSADKITLTYPDKCIDELNRALRQSGDAQIPDISDSSRFAHSKEFAMELGTALAHSGPGVAIVDRLPSEKYSETDNRRICGMFSSFLGDLMEQDIVGTTLYDVKNKNPKNPDLVRKSITNRAQPYHTDGGWHRKPAKFVGLYCVRNARDGGGSRVTSIMNAFHIMQREHPNHLNALLRFNPWDRQGEHAAGDSETEMNPVFEATDNEFIARFYESYIRNGVKKRGQSIETELDEALSCLRSVLETHPAISFQMTDGQFQYLNNWTVVHAREAFDDTESTPKDQSRHVIRVWNC